jgi:hypothetical protein
LCLTIRMTSLRLRPNAWITALDMLNSRTCLRATQQQRFFVGGRDTSPQPPTQAEPDVGSRSRPSVYHGGPTRRQGRAAGVGRGKGRLGYDKHPPVLQGGNRERPFFYRPLVKRRSVLSLSLSLSLSHQLSFFSLSVPHDIPRDPF